MDLWGWCIEEAEGSLEGNFPELVEEAGLCEIIDLTRCCVLPGCWACKGLEIIGFPPEEAELSAVSKVVGKSMSLWIWIPSPGPIWEIWLKLEGAEIILERRSGFLKRYEWLWYFGQKLHDQKGNKIVFVFLEHSRLLYFVGYFSMCVILVLVCMIQKRNSNYKLIK